MSRGVIDMLLALVAFTAMNALVKLGGQHFTPLELVFWRSALGAALVLPLALGRRGLRLASFRLMLLRTLLGVAAMFSGFLALQGLTLAEVTLVSQLQPVLVALGAPLLLGDGERAGRSLWGALGLGLVGGLVILGPSAAAGSWWGLAALLSALFSAGAHLCLRPLGKGEDDRAIVFWFLAGSAMVAAAAAPWIDGVAVGAPSAASWGLLAGLAVTATAGQLFMTRAYQLERAAVVATVAYAAPLLATLIDALVFGIVPGWNAYAGGGLVVIAGLTLLSGGLPTPARLAALVRRPAVV